MLNISIYQNNESSASADDVSLNTTTDLNLDLTGARSNVSKIVGTICNEVFHTMDVYAACGSNYVKCNAPTHVRMKVAGVVIDTGTMDRKLSASLRVGHTAKGKKRFAMRLFNMVNFALHTVVEADHFDNVEKLEKEIAQI